MNKPFSSLDQPLKSVDQLAIDTIRCLAIDMVEQANSGHPGMPMGMAAAAHVLWSRHLKFDPKAPDWLDRDRFVLSAGHGSALLYALLHLGGYDLPIEELRHFRQWGSRTPGHPEVGVTPGVELTTGPLGQGIASAVGLAIEETFLAPQVPAGLVDHFTYVIAGDGCLQEGVSAEAASLAGHLKLGKLIVLWDDNGITIDGETELSFTEDVAARYAAYGWQVLRVEDGNDIEAVDQAIQAAKAESGRPSLIAVRTIIGFGSPNKQGSHAVHGSPLGATEVQATKAAMGWLTAAPFTVPEAVRQFYAGRVKLNAALRSEWLGRWDVFQSAESSIAQALAGKGPDLEALKPVFEPGGSIATRSASGAVLDALMPHLPLVLGGSADLTPSNNTFFRGAQDYNPENRAGRYLRYGVREHAMGAVLNGLSAGGTLRAYGGTFMVFSDYMRPAIRVAALSHYPSIFVLTHDSIGLGEDGPTHQPVETLAALRAIPGLRVYRPADANETAQSWMAILADRRHPAALVLSRQALPVLPVPEGAVSRGAYVLAEDDKAEVLLLATGSEVSLALEARQLLAQRHVRARVVSMPSWEIFAAQPREYREAVLPPDIRARVGIEAAIRLGWDQWLGDAGRFVGMSGFGASAPAGRLFREFGITAEAIADAAEDSLRQTRS